MIKILAISGSPVENSSTDYICTELAKKTGVALGEKTEINFIKLSEFNFIPCQACGKAPTPQFCFYQELDSIYDLLVNCDLLIFGSPVYFDTVSAQAKTFIDRCNCIRPPDFERRNPGHDFIKLLKRKRPGAIVLVGGENGWFEGARRTIAGFFKWVEVVNSGQIFYSTKDFNKLCEAKADAEIPKQINELASVLAEKIKSDDQR